MQNSVQKQLFEEISGYIRNRTTSLAESAMPHPASSYFDPEHLAREKRLFHGFPLVAGHSQQLPEPGAFICDRILGVSLIIARQEDGGLKAFRNICSHRGSPLTMEQEGQAKQFVCPYHSWSYHIDGSLKAVYKPGFPDIDRRALGLPQVSVAERHGLIWVQMDGAPIDLETYLGDIDAELASFDIEGHALVRREVFEADINWKSVLDGFREAYHFAPLHANSIAPYFYPNLSPYKAFGINGRMVGVRKSFAPLLDQPFREDEMLPHIASNYQLFPNTVVVWQGDHFEAWTSFPGDEPGKCRVLFMMLVPRNAVESSARRWERNMEIIRATVMDEDWRMSQYVQAGLPHIANRQVVFGANEPALQHFHGTLVRKIAEMN